MIKVSKKAKDKQRQLYMVCSNCIIYIKDFLFVLFFAFLIGGIVEDKDLHLKISKSLVSLQDFFPEFQNVSNN